MRYYQLIGREGQARLAAEIQTGVLADLTSLDEDLTDLHRMALVASLSELGIDQVARRVLDQGQPAVFDLAQVVEDSRARTGQAWLRRPVEPPEVWAAGVTYKSSERERRRESDSPDVYSKVYVAERPELFFKATSERCVGPFESLGIRTDSEWNVPEPEMAFVLYKGKIIGYTIGNDMSSRSIEGENPLYLPQAKVYDRCCSIGPCLATPDTVGDPKDRVIRCTVSRGEKEIFHGETSTALMARTFEELAGWLQRSNFVPNMTAVLTGTAIVPPPDFTLQEGDIVTITIEGIGTLENDVTLV